MNWSNYIIMQWLPTYMARNLSAETHDIMFTALPYMLNSIVGVGEFSSSVVAAEEPRSVQFFRQALNTIHHFYRVVRKCAAICVLMVPIEWITWAFLYVGVA